MSTDQITLADALALTGEGDVQTAEVRDGFDVFGVPHGGYLAALAAGAVLRAAAQPDLFTLTVHYLRKAAVGPLAFRVATTGGSRRFTSLTSTATQDGQPVLAVMASVGDRAALDGPVWADEPAWSPDEAVLTPPAGSPELSFPTPNIAQRHRMRLDTATTGYVGGRTGDVAEIRAVLEADPTDQLAALIACDLTPPAVWNAFGASGWAPTVELTAHIRAHPVPGPLTVRATTTQVSGGFFNEDAVVHDADGRLIVQSRQLARMPAPR